MVMMSEGRVGEARTPRCGAVIFLAAFFVAVSGGAARAACDEVRGADAHFSASAFAAAEDLASATCDQPLHRRLASVRYWRPERGVYLREEVWAFGPEDARGTCYIDAEANAAGEPDQIILRCKATYLCPDGTAVRQDPVICERAG